MSVLRQLNILGQMRIDVPHIRSVESSIAADFDTVVGRGIAGDQGLVVRGFSLTNIDVGTVASNIQMLTADGIVYNINASESGSFLWVPPDRATEQLNTSNPRVSGSFTANTVNYVGIDFKRSADASTTDLAQFLDANTLKENGRNIPLGRTLDYVILISTAPFSTTPNIVPIAKVTTDANNAVASIQDARAMMFRLASGGDNPDPQFAYPFPFGRQEDNVTDTFSGGDKNIVSNKDWMNATMTRIWEIGGGENWYSPTADRNIRMARAPAPAVFSNGENWETIGIHTHWQGLTIMFENANGASVFYNDIKDQLTDDVINLTTALNPGDCLYVDLDRTQNCTGPTALVAKRAPMQSMGTPTVPGSRVIIAWRTSNNATIDIYTRDYPYLSNVTILPATSTSVGGVRLNQPAAISPVPLGATPTVLTIAQHNIVNIGVTYPPEGFNPALNVLGANGHGIFSTGGAGGQSGVYGLGGPGAGTGISGEGASDGGGGVGVFGQGRGVGDGVSGIGGASNGRGASFQGGATNGDGMLATGSGNGKGVYGHGGSGGGHGVFGLGGGTSSSIGVFGNSIGSLSGVYGVGDTGINPSSGPGVTGEGGTPNGDGVRGFAKGTGTGVVGVGAGTSFAGGTNVGVYGKGSSSGSTGVKGQGTVGAAGGVFIGGPTDGAGISGLGIGAGYGGIFVGGLTAAGAQAFGGNFSGTGDGLEAGGGSTGGNGVSGIGGGANGIGVIGTGGSANGIGVKGTASGTGSGVVGYSSAASGSPTASTGGSFFGTNLGIFAAGSGAGVQGGIIQGGTSGNSKGLEVISYGNAPSIDAFAGDGNNSKIVIQAEGHYGVFGSNPAITDSWHNTITPKNICKAWANFSFNNTVSPPVADGFNITSITQSATGASNFHITISFAGDFNDTNYGCWITFSSPVYASANWSKATGTMIFEIWTAGPGPTQVHSDTLNVFPAIQCQVMFMGNN